MSQESLPASAVPHPDCPVDEIFCSKGCAPWKTYEQQRKTGGRGEAGPATAPLDKEALRRLGQRTLDHAWNGGNNPCPVYDELAGRILGDFPDLNDPSKPSPQPPEAL